MIEVIRVTVATDEVRALILELDQVLSAEYSPEQRHGLALEAIFQPHIRFFIARGRVPGDGVGAVGKWLACATAESLA